MAAYRKIPATGNVELDRVNQAVYEALLAIAPPPAFQAITIAKDYAARGDEGVIHVDSSGGPVRITLPKPSVTLPPLVVKQVNASKSPRATFGPVTVVAANAAKTIAGASAFALDASGTGSVTFTSDGQQHWPGAAAGGNPSVPPAVIPPTPYVPPVSATFVPLTRIINTISPLLGGGPLSSDLTLSIDPSALSKFYQFVDDPTVGTQPQRGRLGFGESASTLVTNDDAGNDRTNVELAQVGGNPFDTGAANIPGRIITNRYGQIILANSIAVGSGLTLSGGTLSATGGGTGTVTTVTGTAPIFITSTPTTTPNVTIRGAVTTGGTSTSATSLGALASGVLQHTVTAGVSVPSVFAAGSARVPFGSGSNGQLTDNANLQYVSGALVISSSNGSSNAVELSQAAAQQINKSGGGALFVGTQTADFLGLYTSNATRLKITSAGDVQIGALSASGLVKAAVTTGQLGIAVAGTDYQAPVVWPAASQVVISAGVAIDPQGDSNFTFDRVAHTLAAGSAIAVNGAGIASNVSVVVGTTTSVNRDRVILFVGGGALGATGTSDNTLVDVTPGNTTIRAAVTGGIYATQRIRAITYAGAGTAITEAATLYIDGAPNLGGGISSGGPWAIHVANGVSLFNQTLRVTALNAGGVVATDTNGTMGIAGVAGLAAAVCGEQNYYVNVTGSTLVTGGAVWLGTSSTAGQGGTALEYVQSFAATNVALKVRIITNAITSRTLVVQITRNGASFSTITLNNVSSGTLTTGVVSVGSPSASDQWGVLVSGTGTGMSGAMIFTASLLLAPNVF